MMIEEDLALQELNNKSKTIADKMRLLKAVLLLDERTAYRRVKEGKFTRLEEKVLIDNNLEEFL